MRAHATAVVLAGALLAAAPAASADESFHDVHFATRGSIAIRWHGDRARGCAPAGLCGYSGTIRYAPRPRAFLEWFGRRPTPGEASGLVLMTGPTRVRVRRAVPGAKAATCTSSDPSSAFTFDVSRAYGDRAWLALGTQIFPAPIVAGQCAGPRLADVVPSLPSAAVRLRHLLRRGTRVSLAGRFPLHGGAISGEVISTLRLTTRGSRGEHEGHTSFEPNRDRHRELFVELEYRVVRTQGEVRDDFRAVEAPVCRLRDACGTHGSAVLSIAEEGGRLEVFGVTRARSRHAPSLRRAIRTIARHGGLEGDAEGGRGSGLTSDVLVRPGSPRCTDQFRPGRTYLVLGVRRRGRAQLRADGAVLDGRCPGPAGDPESSLAIGRFDPALLAHRAFTLVLRHDSGFAQGAYRGRRTAHVEIRLRRTRAIARVVRPDREGGISF